MSRYKNEVDSAKKPYKCDSYLLLCALALTVERARSRRSRSTRCRPRRTRETHRRETESGVEFHFQLELRITFSDFIQPFA